MYPFQAPFWVGWVDWSGLGREQQSLFRDWLGLEQLSTSRLSEIGLAVEQQSSFRDWLGLEQLNGSRCSEIGLDWSNWAAVVFQRLAWTGAIEQQSSLFRDWLWLEQLSSSRCSEIGLDVKGSESRQKKEEARLGTSLSWGRVSEGWRALDGWRSPEKNVRTLIFQRDSSPIYAIAPLLRTMCINFVDWGLVLFCLARVDFVLFTILLTWSTILLCYNSITWNSKKLETFKRIEIFKSRYVTPRSFPNIFL